MRIFYGDAAVDKERFIFSQIDPGHKTILIVPDQFSLQAERDALEYLNKGALTELMVADFSSLGHKVVQEVDGREPEIIDRYGRHILLSVLIDGMEDQLGVYRSHRSAATFVDQMNTMISELKRYGVTPDMLEETRDAVVSQRQGSSDSWLSRKLEDILAVYRAYEDAIDGIYRDAEDYITYYGDLIPRSDLVKGAQVWIFGFDTFTPKNLHVIRRLAETAEEVNVVLTWEDGKDAPAKVRELTLNRGAGLFEITQHVMAGLRDVAREAGTECAFGRIQGARRQTIWDGTDEEIGGRITLRQTADGFREAEAAAAHIIHLVRDEGYRYGDIAVICNDSAKLGRTMIRTMERWGIPVFADQRRSILHQPVVGFLLSFFDVIAGGLRGEALLGMIKSGLLGWTVEEENLLENYIRQFRIRGERWKKPFTATGDQYTEEELARLNELREQLVSVTERARDSVGRRNTAGEKIKGLYAFLRDDFDLPGRIPEIIRRQQEMDLDEGAAETAQIWNTICGIFDQIVRVVGEEKISNRNLGELIDVGLQIVEIGLVPAGIDRVLCGTLQRTRPGRIRALIVVGAADGVLPLTPTPDGLLSIREMEVLEGLDLEMARKEKVAAREEQLAIYRMFSLPTENLYVSYHQNDGGNEVLRPSHVFEALKKWQPEVRGDLEEDGLLEMVTSPRGTISYLADAIRRKKAGDAVDPNWNQVAKWYGENDPAALERIRRASGFDNRREALEEDLADALYRGDREDIRVSASRLEKFGGCPFAHFIQYGLRAQEQRLFEVGGREIGDAYHRCIMEYSQALSEEGSWATITEEECRERIREILASDAEGYREGVFTEDSYNAFRMDRIAEICGDVAWVLTEQIRQGSIRRMRFEEPFGWGKLPAIQVPVGDRIVRMVGVIDRLDELETGDQVPALRIIDYKTGGNDIDEEEIRNGYQLQLMVYMDAAQQASKAGEAGPGDGAGEAGSGTGGEPAGVFYFRIKDFLADLDKNRSVDPGDPESVKEHLRKNYRMDGLVVNDPRILGAIDEKIDGSDKGESSVIKVQYDPKKEAYKALSGNLLFEREEFRELLEITRRQVENLCRRMVAGEIHPAPHRRNKKDSSGSRITACRYCDFKSICMFDPAMPGCRYR